MTNVELVQADLLDSSSISAAFANASLVIHAAAPMPTEFPKTFEEVSKTTVDGTLTVLRACKAAGVQRLVMTSHYGAINMVDELDRPDVFDETIWSDLEAEKFQHIHKSKTMAE